MKIDFLIYGDSLLITDKHKMDIPSIRTAHDECIKMIVDKYGKIEKCLMFDC